jgi:hypothetical protein
MRENVWVAFCPHGPAVSQSRRRGNGPLQNVVKGVYTFTCIPYSSHITPSIAQDMTIVSKIGPMIVVGLLKLRVRRKNPLVELAPPRANRERDKMIQRVASSWHT